MRLETEATSRALKLLDIVPGDSLFKKTTFVTIGGSILTVAIANDLYICNHESVHLLAFVLLMRFLYLKVGPLIDNWATQGLAVSPKKCE